MLDTFKAAFTAVQALVRNFDSNKPYYLSPTYQEQEARRDFIDKFWMALGWDVNHDTQKNPYEQEVKVERKEHGHSQRRADYAFYLAPNFRDVKFYVEAKKPHGDIATADNYFQAARYGWSSHTPISVLHDFEQFEIVDCRYRPHIDTALAQSLRKYHFSHYLDQEKFAEIYWLFSREAVANGSLEKFAETLPKKKGKAVQRGLFPGAYQSIDDAFLEELDEHREALAKAFKNENPDLDGESLTEIVQRTLDRLVFLRFLEDKHIESQNHIACFGDKGTAWQDFIAQSRRLDGIYNGIVFKEHPILDKPSLKPDDEIFSGICERLAHINSPYDFNAVPIHILGSIYERFLGKVIVTTDKRARVEEKPAVRKAGGVYYTPEYIVRYIVENTVGKLIEGKTPGQIAELRFADIACGSGSFLLGVYDLLLRYHTKWYNEHPDKAKIGGKGKKEQKADCVEREDGLHLSLQKKREILVNNIFGVDIDAQAVEVAQLSLYLKLLQDETPGSTREHQLEFHEALLPSLNRNIVCGNSLIGTDILDGQLFAGDEERKLNPMNFEDAFPHIFKRKSWSELKDASVSPLEFDWPVIPPGCVNYTEDNPAPRKAARMPREFEGGFDAIVGNPPYIRIQVMQESSPASAEYLKRKYVSASKGNYDIYVVFAEKALSLLNSRGVLGYILPNKFFNSQYGGGLRAKLSSGKHLSHIVHFGDQQVFTGATTYTCLLFLDRAPSESCEVVVVRDLEEWRATEAGQYGSIPETWFNEGEWNIVLGEKGDLRKRLPTLGKPLGELADIFVGLQTSADKVFVLNDPRLVERKILKPFLLTGGLQAYKAAEANAWLIFPYEIEDGRAELFEPSRFSKQFPKAWAYLKQHEKLLRSRDGGKWNHDRWYAFGRSQNLTEMSAPKLVVQVTAAKPTVILDELGLCMSGGGAGPFYGIRPSSGVAFSLSFLLGILNSKFFGWVVSSQSTPLRGGYFKYSKQYIETTPIPSPDKACHDQMVQLVEQMLEAKKQLAAAQTEKDRTYFENKCTSLDRQIDALVYNLYGLTVSEIKIVEGATA